MRIMIATAVLALFMAPHSVSAQDRAARDARDSEVSMSKAYTAEAQERIWDRKMKMITRGICTGC
jgi:hypothetical protein